MWYIFQRVQWNIVSKSIFSFSTDTVSILCIHFHFNLISCFKALNNVVKKITVLPAKKLNGIFKMQKTMINMQKFLKLSKPQWVLLSEKSLHIGKKFQIDKVTEMHE